MSAPSRSRQQSRSDAQIAASGTETLIADYDDPGTPEDVQWAIWAELEARARRGDDDAADFIG